MDKTKLERIGELSRKSRTVGLSREEADEQHSLRSEYLAEIRGQFSDVLEHTYIQYPDGSKEKLKKKDPDFPIS